MPDPSNVDFTDDDGCIPDAVRNGSARRTNGLVDESAAVLLNLQDHHGPVPRTAKAGEPTSVPLVFARSVNAARFPDLVAKLIPAASPTETGDSTAIASRVVSLSLLPALRTLPAPFLPLTIPDPFEAIRTVRLRNPIPDTDAPASHPVRPERPMLK